MLQHTVRAGSPVRTAHLLTAGIVAGPLLLITWAVQAATREGFDPRRHPMSLLALGDHGWIQVANFILTGLLYLVCAVGLRRALHPGPAATWGPILVAGVGLGLIIAGVFVTDAGAGFPVGAPEGAPVMTARGAVHEIGFALTQVCWIAACLVFRRRFVARQDRVWTVACVVAPIVAVVVAGLPDPDSFAPRLMVATLIEFGFLAALVAHVRRCR